MNLRPKPLLAVAMFALGVVSTPALSQDSGWVIGAGAGQSYYNDGCLTLVAPGAACDDGAVAWRAFVGYQFNSYFGYEIGYANLGKMKQTVGGAEVASFETTAIDAVLVATLPVSQSFAFFVKWGVFSWDMDRIIAGVGTTNVSGSDITYTWGMKYNLTKSISLRAEQQRYMHVGDASVTGEASVTVNLLSLAFQF
jgi:OmpA-OmpF porin, OOP family